MKTEVTTVRRLGPVPFWRGEKRVREQLEEIYRQAIEKAADVLRSPDPSEGGRTTAGGRLRTKGGRRG